MKNSRTILLQNRIKSSCFKLLAFVLQALLFVFFISCQTTKTSLSNSQTKTQELASENYVWSWDFPEYALYITKIDLDTPGIQLKYQVNTDNLFSVKDFAQKNGLNYAFNTTSFAQDDKNGVTLLGVTKFNDEIITPPVEKYSALGFYHNQEGKLRARVIQNQTEEDLEKVETAFGGYFTILKDSELIEYLDTKKSRMGCGIDADGRFLYIIAVTSFNIFGESGLSYGDCAMIFQYLGCTDAMEFDGGHSTSLVTPESGYVHPVMNRKIPAAAGFYVP